MFDIWEIYGITPLVGCHCSPFSNSETAEVCSSQVMYRENFGGPFLSLFQ
jgi:hypothetical protein